VAALARFAARFQAELNVLRSGLGPLPERTDPTRHAALLLHRAMFHHFLREAGFSQSHDADEAVASRLFAGYRCCLDDASGEDVLTPDIFGCLLDKHVSRKESGTYYTGRDVSRYIASATIVPALLDAITTRCPQLLGAAVTSDRVNDLITRNTDPAAFAVAAISRCQESQSLHAVWQSLRELTILDPTCGCGEFLVAALRVLEPLYEACLERMLSLRDRTTKRLLGQVRGHATPAHFVRTLILRRNLYGIDVMPEAAEIARMRLLLMLAAVAYSHREAPSLDLTDRVRCGDVLAGPDPFPGITRRREFSAVLGNPPYVELRSAAAIPQERRYRTAMCGNLYALVMERSLSLLAADGRLGMIVPHSAVCTDRMGPLLSLLTEGATAWVSTYDIRPCKLFAGVDQRLAIVLRRAAPEKQTYSTRYHRWFGAERPALFQRLCYLDVTGLHYENSIPKLGEPIEARIWHKMHAVAPLADDLGGREVIYYHNAPRYWVRAMSFAPYFWNARDGEKLSAQVKTLRVRDASEARALTALLNSNLFCWWWLVLSDCRHLNRREIDRFPAGLARMSRDCNKALDRLCRRLMADYRRHAVRKVCRYRTTGKVVYDEFYPGRSKAIIDDIDRALAGHYGFSEEELELLVNYDMKYRMGSND
jgi:hypothetical protein